jgi:DNA (cytosine-5)-methyltransferase 1
VSSVYYNEIDPRAADWLRELMKAGVIDDGEIDTRSIVDVRADDLRGFHQCHFFAGIGGWAYALKLAGWGDRAVWTGSCPCQPWSMAGKGEGADDPRHLWPSWFRLIRERRPATLFGEQVASLDGLYWLDLVYHDLEAADYAVGTVDLPACSVGAPHKRSRLWIVAGADGGHTVERPLQRNDGHRLGAEDTGSLHLADTDSGGQRAGGTAQTPRWPGAREPHAHERGEASGMGDAAGARCAGREDAGADHRNASEGSGRQQSERASRDGVLDNAASDRLQGRAGGWSESQGRLRGEFVMGRGDGGVVAGFWADAEWIPCSDGKARPVEPGTFPLAHGIPARVGRLRGYGNAIVPVVASEVVKAYMEVKGWR